ncbi:hypothetical protein ABGN05_29660, partial [Aquibium sp. LZ166]
GILVIPPLATITISKKLIIVGLFTFGCIVAIRTDSPFLAFPEYPAIHIIAHGALMAFAGLIISWFWD